MKWVRSPSRYSIRGAIAASLRRGGAGLECTARQLGISPRSLQRRLAEIGTSYSLLVAEIRLDAACHLLVESHEKIGKIATRLGYAGPSSFNRSFMRVMKIQPGAYRRQQLSQGSSISRKFARKRRPDRNRHLPRASD